MTETANATGTPNSAHVASLKVAIRIAATPEAVWQALTTDLAKWWPRSFYCGSSSRPDASATILLEPWPGGRMWEDWGNGEGLLWGTVQTVVIGQRLDFVGHTAPAWGGPSTLCGSYTLEADGDGTRVQLDEASFG
ncbi:MAG: SRPBCC domain-containing protein, partial [Acidobacteriota bacterium]